MSTNVSNDDIHAIEALIARQFQSLNWTPGTAGDWDTFARDFHPDAALYPAARPAKRQTVADFLERMKGLSQTSLRTFHETPLGTKVLLFGNIAVAMAGCRIVENDSDVTHSVEAFLLVKEAGSWRIVSQAWDTGRDLNALPGCLRS